jgi:uncharacterized membrane protein YwaF
MARYPVTVAACFALIVLVAWAGRALRARDKEHRLRLMLGGAVLGVWLAIQGWYLWPANFDPAVSWPLHVCDIAALVGPLALLTRCGCAAWCFTSGVSR